MSGTVVKWLVEPGAEVAAGDPVVVLEAMKMETRREQMGGCRGESAEAKVGLHLVAGLHGCGAKALPLGNEGIRARHEEAARGGQPYTPAVLRQQLHSKHALELPQLRGDRGGRITSELRGCANSAAPGKHPKRDEPWINHASILHGYLQNLALLLQLL
jgi:hypothetical protein